MALGGYTCQNVRALSGSFNWRRHLVRLVEGDKGDERGLKEVVRRDRDRGHCLEGEASLEEVFLVVDEGEPEFPGKGRSHCVVQRRGECHK